MRKLLNIGTAKITKEEMDGVKHHLIDFLEPISEYSIKDFQDDARDIIDNMETIPFIVGGSGLYVDAVITDYDLTNEKRDSNLEEQYKDLSNEELYNKLYELNQEAALKTHPNNRKRVLRYLEIVLEKGELVNKPNTPHYDALIIFLNKDREDLYNNINKRCEIMFDEGWIDEVKSLKDLGYDINLIKEIGYKEISDYLDGSLSYDEMIDKIKQETRRYAKRQITWFKRNDKINWINPLSSPINDIIKEISNLYHNQ
jgi:tRNA dimethylallyltransferase